MVGAECLFMKCGAVNQQLDALCGMDAFYFNARTCKRHIRAESLADKGFTQ
jgi:hypothetical protein